MTPAVCSQSLFEYFPWVCCSPEMVIKMSVAEVNINTEQYGVVPPSKSIRDSISWHVFILNAVHFFYQNKYIGVKMGRISPWNKLNKVLYVFTGKTSYFSIKTFMIFPLPREAYYEHLNEKTKRFHEKKSPPPFAWKLRIRGTVLSIIPIYIALSLRDSPSLPPIVREHRCIVRGLDSIAGMEWRTGQNTRASFERTAPKNWLMKKDNKMASNARLYLFFSSSPALYLVCRFRVSQGTSSQRGSRSRRQYTTRVRVTMRPAVLVAALVRSTTEDAQGSLVFMNEDGLKKIPRYDEESKSGTEYSLLHVGVFFYMV